MVARRIIFIGRVQGVGFRFTAHRMAGRHQLTGFVRNLRDGTVEMLAQGNSKDIDACIRDIDDYLSGHIRQTKVEEVPSDPSFTEFKITF